jgi:hypothetical protein
MIFAETPERTSNAAPGHASASSGVSVPDEGNRLLDPGNHGQPQVAIDYSI